MATHIRILGWLHILFGALGLVGALVAMAVFGGIAGAVGLSRTQDAAAAPVMVFIGGVVMIIILVLSLPGLIGGIGLIGFKPWSRVFMIILSALHLINIPFGTALGIYGLWVLLNRETEWLFANHGAAPYVPVQAHPAYPPANPPYTPPPGPYQGA